MTRVNADEIIEFIQKNLTDKDLYRKIVERYYYHPIYVNVQFKMQTGKSISQYITETKMEVIHKLISEGKSCHEAVSATGVTDIGWASRRYKKLFGEKMIDTKMRATEEGV